MYSNLLYCSYLWHLYECLTHSGPNDYVFVNFADHGAPGFVAFPNGEVSGTALKAHAAADLFTILLFSPVAHSSAAEQSNQEHAHSVQVQADGRLR